MIKGNWRTGAATPAETIRNALVRQERTVLARIGAWWPLEDALKIDRWTVELQADLALAGVSAEHASQGAREVSSELQTLLQSVHRRYGEKNDRLQGIRAIYADLLSRVDRFSVCAPVDQAQLAAMEFILYKLYDPARRLLYVGITDRGPVRLVEHYRHKEWFPLVTRVEFERYSTRAEVLRREKEAIQSMKPIHNIQHNHQRDGEYL